MKSVRQRNVRMLSSRSVANVVGEPAVAAVPLSPTQEQLLKSDRISLLFSESMRRSPLNNNEANDNDVSALLSGDDQAVAYASSIISSHEASFYSSLKVSRADNLDGLESCTNRIGHGFISTPTGATAEKYVSERIPSAVPRLFTPKRPLAASSSNFHGKEEEAEANAAMETASEQGASSGDAGKVEELGGAAKRPQSISANEDCSRCSQSHAPHYRLASPAGEVKTLQELLDWRAHLFAWQESLDMHEGNNAHDTESTLKDMCGDQAGDVNPVGPVHEEGASGSVQPTIAMAETSRSSSASPHRGALRGCHAGFHRTSAACSSSPTKTPSKAAGEGAIAVAQLSCSGHSHTLSGAASQTESANDFTAKSSLRLSSQPSSPVLMEEGQPRSTGQRAQPEKRHSPHENAVTRASPRARVAINIRASREGVGTGRCSRPSGAGSPVLSSLWCLEGTEPEDHASPTNAERRTPFGHSALSPRHERRPWVRGALPTAGLTPLGPYSSPASGYDGYRSRDNWNSPYPGSGRSTISSSDIQRQHSHDALSPKATPRTPKSWSHKMKALPPTMKLKDLGVEDEVPVFAVPVDEETNKAVVGFVSALVLLICLVFICAM
ncbi:hypothetical protein LSCM4_03306 [Leishmania orientalis]|uniref:Uncharacterized protein n=1 Tax=Leishmania orientalis TaxID=2249476 RepID=A0A836GXV7_9TRYP|nr:hypothetical protein LSCM4_03306 [Leishmania orientalis]